MRGKGFLLLLLFLLPLALVGMGETRGAVCDLERSSGNRLEAATFDDLLLIRPGTSRAYRHDRVPPWQPVAQTDESGRVVLLDFGEIFSFPSPPPHPPLPPQPLREARGFGFRYFRDVIRIRNISDSPLSVKAAARGEISSFLRFIRLRAGGEYGNPVILEPGEEARLEVLVLIPPGTPPGDRRGEMEISSCYSREISSLLTVRSLKGEVERWWRSPPRERISSSSSRR